MLNRIRFIALCFSLFLPLVVAVPSHAQDESDEKLARLLADPNTTVTSIEQSPYRAPRYFIGGHAGIITSDPNRLVNGYGGEVDNATLLSGHFGIDYSPRLTIKGAGHWYTFNSLDGFAAYSIYTVSGGAQINLRRTRGYVPYIKIMGGAAYTSRNLSKQFSSTATNITIGEDTSTIIDVGVGLMYDPPKSWLADGDVRLLLDFATRRDNNDKATPVNFFQEGMVSLGAEYLFGSSVFFGQKVVVEREVTSDEGTGGVGFLREKREPVLYPSAAELAALSDKSRPNIIFFNKYSSYVVDTQMPKLDTLVEQMEQNPNSQAVITGHSDTNDFILDRIEQLRFNRAISAKRAVSVYNYFVSRGIEPERLQTQWRADQQRVSTDDTPVGRSLNRRVQVQVR